MTQQDILALINAKIKGQGSAIDIGGALPAILGGLTEQAFKAVSVDSTDMTEKDQMQIRKNLGLYYETPEETNTVNGTDEGEIYEQSGGNTYKHISDDTPSPRKIKSVTKDGEEVEYSVDDTYFPEGYFTVNVGYTTAFLIIITGNSYFPGFPKGIYVATYSAELMEYSLEYITQEAYVEKIPEEYLPESGTSDAVQYIPQELTESQQMQARKNQDLYYEEEGESEKETPSYDGGQTTELYKLSDDTPAQEDIIGVRLNGTQYPIGEQGISILESDYGYTVYIWDEVEGANLSLFEVNLVDDTEVGTGIFLYPYYYENYSQRLIYNETITTVHQIPAKYLPDMPSGGAFFVKATYSFPNYTLDKTYAEVLQAIEDGQVVILDLSQVAGASDYFLCSRNTTTQGAANGISFAGITSSGILRGFTLKADDTFVVDYAYSPTAEIEFQQVGNIIEDGGCGLVEINSTSPVSITPTIIGNGGKYANATWSVKRISGSAVFAMTGIGDQFSITASETGVSQAIVSCEYTSSSIIETFTYRLSAIITAVATI